MKTLFENLRMYTSMKNPETYKLLKELAHIDCMIDDLEEKREKLMREIETSATYQDS